MARRAAPEEKQLPIIMTLADIVAWKIGPTKGSAESTLEIRLAVRNWEDVRLVAALASGQVVLRLTPLQYRLPVAGTECEHPDGVQIRYSAAERLCLECGRVYDIPADDLANEREHSFEPGPVDGTCKRCGLGPNEEPHRDGAE